ncbi:MATE family efflux transporter [Kingella kingae]|uniref:MATE family efflux transporter n=1 Tax=Kingella kingae TaxID=504 RepID=UPI0005716416|nr:MATE family efflux transporter [Kingella kingae]
MIFDLNRYSFSNFRREAKQLMSLVLPMMSAQIASVAIGVVDTAMAGAAGKSDLTAVGLGNAVFATVFITFIGIMTALNPTIAQLHGSGEREKVGESGRQGLWFGAFLGVLGMILLLALIAPLKNYLDMNDYIEHMFGQYLLFTALGMPAAMLYRSLHAYASSLNKPSAIMWISWAALLLNIPLNYLFIYGKFDFPQLGGAGAGVATAIVFWFNAIALWIYIAKTPYFHTFGLTQTFTLPHWRTQWQLLKLGLPIGFSYFLEASLFTFIVWLIADLGNDYVAAQQIVISLTSVIYMIPQAIGTAATVRIGYSLGKRHFARARYISGVSLSVGAVLAVCTLTGLLFGREFFVSLYNKDPNVIRIAVQICLFAAIFQVFDFMQCIASYALRGYKITRVPMIIHAIAFWLLGLLPGYVLAYGLDMGIYGFWVALIVSLCAAAVALVWYLEKCSAWAQNNRGL